MDESAVSVPAERRTRVGRAERRAAVADYQAGILNGRDPADLRDEIQAKFHVTRQAVNRWIDAAAKRWQRRAEGERDVLVAKAVARLDHAMTVAMDRKRPLVLTRPVRDADGLALGVEKYVELLPDPDLDAYVAAIKEQARIQSLYPPEARDEYVEAAADFVRQVFEVVRANEKDFVTLERIAAGCRNLLAAAASRRARPVIVDVAPVASSDLAKHDIPPGTNGTNGHSNGAH